MSWRTRTAIRRFAGVLLAAALTTPALAMATSGTATADVSAAAALGPGSHTCRSSRAYRAPNDSIAWRSDLSTPTAAWRSRSRITGTGPLGSCFTQIPAGAVDSFLSAVSCSGVGACTATGYWVDETFAWHTLAERWDGTGWAIQTTRTPGVEKALTGVSCPTATACIAVGDHFVRDMGRIIVDAAASAPGGERRILSVDDLLHGGRQVGGNVERYRVDPRSARVPDRRFNRLSDIGLLLQSVVLSGNGYVHRNAPNRKRRQGRRRCMERAVVDAGEP